MIYDNTKFRAAIAAWMEARCFVSFGETYCGDLQDDFEDFCSEAGMMKRSPGRVVFGRELTRLGFEKCRKLGLTYWAGILLKTPPTESRPRHYAKTMARREEEWEIREEIQKEKKAEREALRVARRELVMARMKTETERHKRLVREQRRRMGVPSTDPDWD